MPHSDSVSNNNRLVLEYLDGFITDNKRGRIDEVLGQRTRHIKMVVEDIYQSQNASAVIRSCDCFGIQDIHSIENRNRFKINPDVALGASKWTDVIRHNDPSVNNTTACLQNLKDEGYRIIATSPHAQSYSLAELPIEQKFAVVLGNEREGISEAVYELADDFLRIPMYGFTESFNISVSGALCLYELTKRLRESDVAWQLTEREKLDLKLKWIKRIVKRADLLEKEFLQNL